MAPYFEDRKPNRPNRYKVTPDSGTAYYVTLERADEPTVLGTPLNAEVLNNLFDDLDGQLAARLSMDLLWENAKPTSSFGAQTVSLDLSEYTHILTFFRVFAGSGEYSAETFGVHGLVGNWCMAVCNTESGSNPSQRAFKITTTGISFSSAYYCNTVGGSLTSSSNILVPYRIYGIKGVA